MIAVMFLHERMWARTAISIRTLLILLDEIAHFGVLQVAFSLPVLGVVVVHAVLVVMIFGDVAGAHFENVEVEVLNE